jgi:F-type H+-transporting ATPase subunit gamma
MHGRYSDELSDGITDQLAGLFLGGSVDEAHVAYTEFTSTLRQKPRIEKLLNVDYQGKIGAEYIIEPDAARVMEELLKEYVYSRFRMMLLNAFTSEHAARMIAMKMATDNANELSEKLTLLRNKARQASITKEVLEVAMAAEALKG